MMIRAATHIPILMRVVSMTNGPILELGMGYYSTTILNWICTIEERELVSYESSKFYFKKFVSYENSFHKLYHVKNWEDADIEKQWDVAFIDHAPGERRREDIKRLANYAQYIICHDSEPSEDLGGREDGLGYQYSLIYPLFKYRYNYDQVVPNTVVLSNFVNVEDVLK